MKTKLSVLLICFFILSNGLTHLAAQVVIGLNEGPEKYSTLQIKDKAIDRTGTLDAATAEKGGLLLPRVELKKKKELLPFVTQAEVDASPQPQEYLDAKKLHTGLVVYNLVEDDEEELCLGINQWDGEQWNCLQNKMGNAIAEIKNCNTLRFTGQYQNNVPLNSSNFMSIELTVTKAGAYTITAMPDPENGYYFTASGVFMATGDYTLTVPGAGTPTDFTPTGDPGDLIKITFNGKALDACDPLYIVVEDSSVKPLYIMDCKSVSAKGVYKLDQELDATNYLQVTLNVDVAAMGARYIIETNTVDGIYFKGEGILNSTPTQTVRLQGFGKPNSVSSKEFILTSNSVTTTATCKGTVIVVIPRKKYASIGGWDYGDPYGYTLGPKNGSRQSPISQMFYSQNNFGALETSTVKFEGVEDSDFIFKTAAGNRSDGISQMADVEVENLLLVTQPDIVFLGYYNSTGWSERKYAAFKKYLEMGGVVIANLQLASSAEGFIKNVFSLPDVTASQRGGYIYQMSGTDEIMNGPFGNVSGKYWGTDAADISVLNNLPQDQFIVYTNGSRSDTGSGTNPSYGQASMFRHRTLNFFFNGEGAIYAAVYPYNTSRTISPFKLDDTTKKPIDKSPYGEPASANWAVSNSTLYANVLAWAIYQAEFHGINTP